MLLNIFIKSKRSIVFIIYLVALFLFQTKVFGQIDNRFFHEGSNNTTWALKNKFSYQFEALGFIKNNEYFNELVDGYTLIGHQILPSITYKSGNYTKITAGIFIEQAYGETKINKIIPTFTLEYQKDSLQLIFGQLRGNLQHQLIEPLYNFENILDRRLENGIQLKTQNRFLVTDTWVDWQKFIRKGSDFQEEIWAGTHLSFKYSAKSPSLVLQLTAKHKGGQINIGLGRIQTTLNAALGLKYKFDFVKSGFLKSLSTEHYLVLSKTDISTNKQLKDGLGISNSISLNTKILNLTLNYWLSDGYIAPNGGDLYQSISTNFKSTDYIEYNRNLLILRLIKEINLDKNLSLSIRFEPYFNFNAKELEHSEGIYLRYLISGGFGK